MIVGDCNMWGQWSYILRFSLDLALSVVMVMVMVVVLSGVSLDLYVVALERYY